MLDTGVESDICLFNDGTVIEVHKSSRTGKLWYNFGKVSLEKESIQWKSRNKLQDQKGTTPCLSCNRFGYALSVWRSQKGNKLQFCSGKLSNTRDSVLWDKPSYFCDGQNPSCCISASQVACVSNFGVELSYLLGQLNGRINRLNFAELRVPLAFVENKCVRVKYGSAVTIMHVSTGMHLCIRPTQQVWEIDEKIVVGEMCAAFGSEGVWTVKPLGGLSKNCDVGINEPFILEHFSSKKLMNCSSSLKSEFAQVFASKQGKEAFVQENWLFQSSLSETFLCSNMPFRIEHISGRVLCCKANPLKVNKANVLAFSVEKVRIEEGKSFEVLAATVNFRMEGNENLWLIDKVQN